MKLTYVVADLDQPHKHFELLQRQFLRVWQTLLKVDHSLHTLVLVDNIEKQQSVPMLSL